MVTLQHSTTSTGVLRKLRGAPVDEHAAWAGAQVLLLVVLGATVGLGPLGWSVGLAYGFGTWALLGYALQRLRTALGPADRVTLARGLLVGGVTALVADRIGAGMPTAVVVALATAAVVLDFVDGQVARRTGTSSPLGARFDMEVDAFLILVLSVLVAVALGPWVMAIGAMRYAFVAASRALPWLRAELPHCYVRKVVAATQGVALIAAASGLLPHAEFLVGLALAALLCSFGRDISWLWRTRVEVGSRV